MIETGQTRGQLVIQQGKKKVQKGKEILFTFCA